MEERLQNLLKQVAYVAITEEMNEQCEQKLFVADFFGITVEDLEVLIKELNIEI